MKLNAQIIFNPPDHAMYDLNYAQALAKAEHLKALGQNRVFLDNDAQDLPWDKVARIENGCGYRLNVPTGFYCVVEEDGLTIQWSVEMEGRGANGASVSMFDRDRLRAVSMKLPKRARKLFADFLEDEVLPGLEKCTKEWREYLRKQADSEDCVRGLIAYASSDQP